MYLLKQITVVMMVLSVLQGGSSAMAAQRADAGIGQKAAATEVLSQQASHPTVPDRPAHPFLLFSRSDVTELAKRKEADPLLSRCWERLVRLAAKPDQLDSWWTQLEARAFLWQITGDESMARDAIRLLQAALERTDPRQFYRRAGFHVHAAPLRALALAWDWLYEKIPPPLRGEILAGLERWCDAVFQHTEQQWWREASYNVGAIPIGGLGLLATSIRPDSTHPMAATWYREAARRIGQNYFPLTWKASGICWEGPNYAIVGLRYAATFAEALRRAGGPDLLADSGALRAMQYLMYQWMPWGGCAPIGDNTSYGRRTFAAEYLLGMGRSGDATGLWTWREYTDQRRLDPLITYLWYPLDLERVSPADADVPTSRYFEVTRNRAGYVFSRSRWGDPDAAFFAFVTRFEKSNHQHYDMNSFLLGAFGRLFATHRSLYPYGHVDHGVDFEHNLVIVDGGGWPAHDKSNSCGDDNSTDGFLVGLAMGNFADYVRGDAKWSYRDNTILNSNPAIRAERACLFVKDGATPYLLAIDDLQYSDDEHRYDWLWHAPDAEITGGGTLADPLVISAGAGSCAIHFIEPAEPVVTVKAVESASRRHRARLQRIAAAQRGIRVRYAVVATLQKDPTARPAIRRQPVQCENDSAAAVQIELPDGNVDHMAWQSEEDRIQAGSPLTAGQLQSDGLLAMVRLREGKIVGYVLGEGTYLRWGSKTLVQAEGSTCVVAGPDGVKVFGRRRAREGLPPTEPANVRTVLPEANGRGRDAAKKPSE